MSSLENRLEKIEAVAGIGQIRVEIPSCRLIHENGEVRELEFQIGEPAKKIVLYGQSKEKMPVVSFSLKNN